MLKYFKRQTSRQRSTAEHDDTDRGGGDAVDSSTRVPTELHKRHSLRSTTSFCDEVFLEELNQTEEQEPEFNKYNESDVVSMSSYLWNADEDIFNYHSRLSMSLTSIVSEPNCLSYFVQFLEAKQALSLIKFYLDIENFKRAALTQLEKTQTDELGSAYHFEILEQHKCDEAMLQSDTGNESDEEDNNDVPELKTICDLSMRKPLTDDEKSQIYAQTNKQIINKSNTTLCLKASSEQSLCSVECSGGGGERAISAASCKDAIDIYKKYLIVNAPLYVELPIAILAHISLLLCKRHDGEYDEGSASTAAPISANCFDEARDYVMAQFERAYVQDFLQSSYYCKYCVELIETEISIYDVLYSEVTLFYLMEYLEQHKERACLDFWIAAVNFRKSYATQMLTADMVNANAEAQADAMIIYERFFSLQAGERRLWLSDKMRARVEQRICEPGQVSYAFDLPLLVTAKYLEQKYLGAFLKSQLFENYLNELKTKMLCSEQANAAQSPASTKAKQKSKDAWALSGCAQTHKLSMRRTSSKLAAQARLPRKSMSDCSGGSCNISRISQQNTLLAAMDTVGAKPATTNMQIDANQLSNPQLLWQRPQMVNGGGLKFGRVNSLGRYERDFEGCDAAAFKPNWSLSVGGNKIRNAMRKLVNLPEDKVQEEIAWQVAEMIVKDVTNVTLNGGGRLASM